MKYLIGIAAYLTIGVIFCLIMALIHPERFVFRNEFRYDLAVIVILIWFLSFLYGIAKIILWPIKKIVQRTIKVTE